MWLLAVYLFWRAEEDLRFAPWTGLAFGLAHRHQAQRLLPSGGARPVRGARRVARGGPARHGDAPPHGSVGAGVRGLPARLLLVVQGRGRARQALAPALSPRRSACSGCWRRSRPCASSCAGRTGPPSCRSRRWSRWRSSGPLIFYVALAVPLVPPGGPAAWYFDFPRHPRPLRLVPTSGEVLRAPPFPLAYVFVVTALTLPVSLLVPMALGLSAWRPEPRRPLPPSPALRPRRLHRVAPRRERARSPSRIISHPDVPHFGGVKHWLPSMPFLALLGGASVDRARGGLSRGARPPAAARDAGHRRGSARSSCLPALTRPRTSTRTARRAYGELAGGIPGAASLGLQRQYWSNNVTGVLPWINANTRPGERVWLHEVNGLSVPRLPAQWHAAAGRRPRGRPRGRGPRRRTSTTRSSASRRFNVWQAFGTPVPSTGLYVDETPQVVVYRRPSR